MEKKKINFSDLNGWMKTAIVGGWISILSFVVAFGLELLR